jgi:small subunit ribosomal protein S6e
MMEFKLNIGCPKTKKCVKKELKETDCKPLIGKKIGEVLKGEAIDFPGYEFKITGGSDSSGFPMRHDVDAAQRKRILISSGVGIKKKKRKGIRLRRTVAGNTIHEKTAQINMKILKYGPEPLEKVAEEPKKEKKQEKASKEENKK